MTGEWRDKKLVILCISASTILYLLFAYQLSRNDFPYLISLFSGLFLFYLIFISKIGVEIKPEILFKAGIFFRLLLLFSVPNLSQDFYRFIWDGRLLMNGFNPYLYLPDEVMSAKLTQIPEALQLYSGMGSLSSGHFTNYPPVNQFCFALAALVSGKSILGSVVFFKLLIIAADIGIYTYGRKILAKLKLPENNIYMYYLNPLVIIELTGNLHFEGVMLFFLILALYHLQRGRFMWGATFFALSISLKLIPIVFLPLFVKYLGFKKAISFFTMIGLLTLCLFLPFFSPSFLDNYLSTIALWFVSFEFNASIYYILRTIGYQLVGYNIIHLTGKIIPLFLIAIIFIISFKKQNTSLKNLISNMLFILSIYFFLSTTVHPWYIISLVLLSVFTHWKFPSVWSFTIILSYYAYSNPVFQENSLILILEYSMVYSFLAFELYQNTRRENPQLST